MLVTERTQQAVKLLKSYARTPEQKTTVDNTYRELISDSSNEDNVVIAITGYILDGLRFGNWLWNMPPSAKQVKP